MADANYTVAIEIATSCLVGMVGKKNDDGTVSILATEKEDAGGCIRRGNVYNVEETGMLMKRLVKKLQNRIIDKLPGFRIEKVYVGVGGQSLHSVEHFEMKTLSIDTVVSGHDLRALDGQCHAYRPELEDVLGITAPSYYVDNKPVEQPEGLPAKRIEAHYKLIVGRPSIRNAVISCVKPAGVQLAGIFVSPLSLAEATLGLEDRKNGCVLIGFDTGVTSVAVYKNGVLAHLSVVPLGGQLLVGDLMKSLQLKEEQNAEWLKNRFGLSLAGVRKDVPDSQEKIEIEDKTVTPKRLNAIIEGRVKEIVENVYERMRTTGDVASLGAGIILAGNASDLKNLPELLRQRFNLDVRYATISKERVERTEIKAGDRDYMTAISLLIQGKGDCLTYEAPPAPVPVEAVKPVEKPRGGKERGKGKKPVDGDTGKGGLRSLFDSIRDKGVADLFKED
ncbi:MAG: cell division protein FtsA [Tannerella sp.]|jgi:cell division protein FtsA|nr:cell division protein FtsA [Tannerella sp.]